MRGRHTHTHTDTHTNRRTNQPGLLLEWLGCRFGLNCAKKVLQSKPILWDPAIKKTCNRFEVVITRRPKTKQNKQTNKQTNKRAETTMRYGLTFAWSLSNLLVRRRKGLVKMVLRQDVAQSTANESSPLQQHACLLQRLLSWPPTLRALAGFGWLFEFGFRVEAWKRARRRKERTRLCW